MSKYRYTVTFSLDEWESHDENISKYEEKTRKDLIDIIENNWETASNIKCTIEDNYCIEHNDVIIPKFISKEAQNLEEKTNEYYASAKLILNHLEVHGMKEAPLANDITVALMNAVNCLLEKGGEKIRSDT